MAYNIPKNRTQLRDSAIGFITQNQDLSNFNTSTVLTTQRIQFVLVGLLQGDIISNIHVCVGTVPSGATGTAFVAIYNVQGTQVAVSSNLTTSLDTTGLKSLPVSYTVPQDGAYYLAVLVVNAGTPPAVARANGQGVWPIVGSGVRNQSLQASQTSMPAQAIFASNTGIGIWCGCS